MTRIVRLFSLAATAALVALAIGVPAALAAPAAQWESISLNVNTDASSSLLMVSGQLPDSTTLPATVALAVPAGAEVQWVGEVLGGDPSADIEATPAKTTSGGYDLYTFTLSKARIAQIEAIVPPVVTMSGGVYNVNFSQAAFTDAKEYAIAIQIPQAAQLSETPTGTASLAPGPTGFRYYQQSFANVKTGDPVGAVFAYTLPAGGATGTAAPASGGGGDMLVPILLVGVALLVGAVLVVGVRRKMNPIVEEPPVRSAASRTRKPAATVAADEDGGFSTHEEPAKQPSRKSAARVEDEVEDEAEPAAPRNKIALYGTLGIVTALLVAGVIAVSSGGAAKSTEDTITKVLAGGEACTQAMIPLAIPEGADTAKAAEELFAALGSVPSVTQATVRISTSTMEIGYCDSSTNEDAIRAALAPTGYVAAGTAAPSAPASTTP